MKEFLDGISPIDPNYRDIVVNRKSYNEGTKFKRAQAFTPATTRQVQGFLRALVQTEEGLERVRDNLRLRRNFNMQQAFKALDLKGKGYFTVEDISDHLTSRYLFCTFSEIRLLMARFDKINCGQVSPKEFITEMRPKLINTLGKPMV